jgi:uncharacterized protein (TIGR03067 family)
MHTNPWTRICAVVLTSACLLAVAQAAPVRKPRVQELPGLEGTWKQIYVEFEGVEQTAEYATKNRWVITGATITIVTAGPKGDENRGSWHYNFNPGAMPAEIDLTANFGTPFAKTMPAALLLDGDRLTVCLQNFPERGRPTGFVSRPGSGIGKFIYQRVAAP